MLFGRHTKNPIKIADKGVTDWKYTTCGYCSTGCSIEVGPLTLRPRDLIDS